MFAKLSEFLLGSTSGLNEAEERLLSFVLDALPAGDREILLLQLRSIRKVQRQHPGRPVGAYYGKGSDTPRLPYPGNAYCLANVSHKSGDRARTTSIVLHDGRFMTFERHVPQRLSEIDALESVALHPRGFKSVNRSINTQEHGEVSDQSAEA